MNEENSKLEKVNKSCKTVMIVTRIVFFIFMCASTVLLISGIVMIAQHDKFDDKIPDSAKAKMESNAFLSTPVESDVPSLQEYFDENGDSYGLKAGFLCVLFALMAVIFTVALWLISGAFDAIVKEKNPFSDKAIKKMLIALIFISGALLVTAGIGTGIIAAIITWAVYTIMDYGRILKIQSDETL